MRKRDDKTRETRMFKNFVKNEHLFYRQCLTRPEFLQELFSTSETYFYNFLRENFLKFNSSNILFRFYKRDEMIDLGKKTFLSCLDGEKKGKLTNHIEKTLRLYNLGKEWGETLITLISTGFLCPPVFNLFIDNEKGKLSEEIKNNDQVYKYLRYGTRTVITLNPGTSIEDVKDAWQEIQKEKKLSWPKYKDFNLRKDSNKKLKKSLEMLIAKNNVPEDKKYSSKLSNYQKLLLKEYGPEKARRIAKETNKGLIKDEKLFKGLKDKDLKPKRKLTDTELAIKLLRQEGKEVTGPSKKKKVNLIRQQRHRQKNDTLLA